MAAYDQIKKVRLKDPETLGDSAAILYPITGINAIMAGTSGDNASIYITGSGSGTQIQPQYLAIINASGYVGDQYLKFIDQVDGKILDNYLKFIIPAVSPGETPKIDQSYLPSYVDDVVDVPVINAPEYADPTAYQLMIQVGNSGGVPTYTFYQWNGTQWVQGGGQSSKIYIAANDAGIGDGSIYRCKTGSTTQAIKISENPYVISTDVTNGVGLTNQNGTVAAVAALATNSTPGTIVVNTASPTATNNVSLSIAGGTLSVNAQVASPQQAGIVFAVGTMADYNTRRAAHGDSYLVPTAAWTIDMITSGLAGISYATTTTPGIVQIDPAGHITVDAYGVIAVPEAGMNTAGVVQIVDTIDTTVTGNASKAVTQGGIVGYVASALTPYQKSLQAGSGIDITSANVVSARIAGDMLTFSGGAIVGNAAGATTLGGVVITGDSSYIDNKSATLGGKPIAVNPVAVNDYVTAEIASAMAAMQHPIEGGDGITVTQGETTDTVSVNYAAPLRIDTTTSKLTVSSATSTSMGVVKIPGGSGLVIANGAVGIDSATATNMGGVLITGDATFISTGSATSGGKPLAVNPAAVSTYVASAIAGAQKPITGGDGITVSQYASSATVMVDYTGALDISAGQLYVKEATALSAGIATFPAGSGLEIDGGVVTLDSATATHLGGVRTASANTGIEVADTTGLIKAKVDGHITYINGSNQISVSSASTSSGGVVQILDAAADIGVDSKGGAVPVASAVRNYVASMIAGGTVTVIESTGVIVSSSTTGSSTQYQVGARYATPIIATGSAITVQTASASIDGTLGDNTLGAVYIRGATIRSDFTGVTQIPSTVPTESAVREAINAIPYITYEVWS